MDFNSLLLIAIIWLLWTIHQDLSESNDRQRNLKNALSKLANRLEQTIEPQSKDTKKNSGATHSESGATHSENGTADSEKVEDKP